MSKVELKLNYEGAISSPENVKKDFKKAIRIVALSFISAAVLSSILYLLLFFS